MWFDTTKSAMKKLKVAYNQWRSEGGRGGASAPGRLFSHERDSNLGPFAKHSFTLKITLQQEMNSRTKESVPNDVLSQTRIIFAQLLK